MWYRVFGSNDLPPPPGAVLEHLNAPGVATAGQFHGDAEGWYAADLWVGDVPLRLERFLAGEAGIRAELNSWAAWLETCEESPHHGPLVERMIQTRQLFTLETPDAAPLDPPSTELCRFLAAITEGVYQVDGRGFFAADGTLLVPEPPGG